VIRISAAALCLAFATLPLHAQGDRQPPRRLVLETLDLNHDGQLSPDEIDAASKSLLTLDRNHDGQLSADEYLPQQPNRAAQTDLEQRLLALDHNGDGVLTADELPDRMQPLFQRADSNHDGKVTRDELHALAAAQAAPQGRPTPRNGAEGMARLDPILNALDVDHDGTLTSAEIASAPGALKTLDTNADGTLQASEIRVRQQTPAERAAHILDEWDTNKDGVLTKAECPDRIQAQFDAIDTNHDGKLNSEELTTFFATQPQGRGPGAPRNDAPSAPILPPANGQTAQPQPPQ
jgi:Ca2+-binding EF-hand superfamily protein